MQPIKILLVDDDKNYYNLIQKMLARDSHYILEWVPSFEMALSVANKAKHDAYLVDYRLGEKNGLELLRYLRELHSEVPVILMTGHSDLDFDMKVLEQGATDYIDKVDLKPSILMRTIRYAIQRQKDRIALKQSEENYRMLLADASDGIVILDTSGRILIANSTIAHMLACEQDALIGKKFEEYVKPVPRVGAMFPLSSLEVGHTTIKEQRLRSSNGDYIPVEISAKLMENGRFQCIVRDITHRKEAESAREKYIQRLTILQQIDEEINHMLNMNHVLSLALDAAVRLSAANAGFISTYDNGKLRIEQSIGHYTEMPSGGYLERNDHLAKVIEDQSALLLLDVTQHPGYIATVPETRAQMLIPLTSYERTIGLLNLETNRDDRFTEDTFDFIKLIASRVAVAMENAQLYQIAQEQLAQMQELYRQVSELEQLKTDMIRIAAHDLRNPVGVIVGYLELLEWSLEDKLTEKQRGQIEAMTRAAYRMEKITTDILSLERIEKLHLEKTHQIQLNDIVSEAFQEYQMQAKQKNQKFELAMPENDENLNVQADQAQIREAAANLISNAIKYTPIGGTVKVVLERDENVAEFKVIDTGYGIPEDQQTSLFQPFYRATSDETMDIDGTGLGLHLVKNIITRHDGEMVFTSKYGEGSTFGFRLPIADALTSSA